MGKDRDVGYEILRVSDKQPWKPAYLAQPLYNALLAMLFQWGVAMHDIDLGALRRGEQTLADVRGQLAGIGRKAGKQVAQGLRPVAAARRAVRSCRCCSRNLDREPHAQHVVVRDHLLRPLPRRRARVHRGRRSRARRAAGWYVRQMLGSCNIEGGPLFHILSGNLSHQIEHHLFPDMPSNRYPEVAPRVAALCERYGIPYNTGSFARQLGTTLRTIFRLACPTRRGHWPHDRRPMAPTTRAN